MATFEDEFRKLIEDNDMAIKESEILDKVGKYNLDTLAHNLISTTQRKKLLFIVMEYKGISDVIEIHEDILRHHLWFSYCIWYARYQVNITNWFRKTSIKSKHTGLPLVMILQMRTAHFIFTK